MVRVHSTKSMLGQHGAGSSALQAVAACLMIRRGTAPPTINYEDPDPACGPIRVITEPESFGPSRVLVHSIGLGGFYYSAAALSAPEAAGLNQTGIFQVQWSKDKHPLFHPPDEFQKPLQPWAPRQQ